MRRQMVTTMYNNSVNLCLTYRIEVKQRNFDDLMYDLQSLKEKNERLKDRVRDIETTWTMSCKYINLQFFVFFIQTKKHLHRLIYQAEFSTHAKFCKNQCRVVRKQVNANPGLKVNQSFQFFLFKNVFHFLCFV